MRLTTLQPSVIYFTHSKIRNRFTGCGKTLQETLNELITGVIATSDIPSIRVYTDGTNYYSANNRRLWVFKQLETLGHIKTIEVLLEALPDHSRIKNNTYSLVAKPVLK